MTAGVPAPMVASGEPPGSAPATGERRPSRWTLVAVVAAITLAGLLLRLPSFGDALYGDELSTYFIVTGRGLGGVLHWVRSDLEVSPPLFFVLAWGTHGVGEATEGLRWVSLLAGVAAIPLTYLLGTRTVGRRAALVGSALVAASPYLIFYSTEARSYALVLLLTLLSTLCLLEALDDGATRWWVAYALCSAAAVYSHYVAVFVLLAQFAWAWWAHPAALRSLLVSNAAAALAFAPWIPELLNDRNGPNVLGGLDPFGADSLARNLARWAVVGNPLPKLPSLYGTVAIVLALASVAIGVAGVVRLRRAGRLGRLAPTTVLVLVLASAAPVLAALYSVVGASLFEPRNLIASWPGLALSVGLLATRAGRVAGVAVAVLALAAVSIGGIRMLKAQNRRPDYGSAARFIDRTGAPGDPVVETPLFPNPLSPLDAALGYASPSSERHPVLRIGAAQREAKVGALERGLSPLAPLPVLSTRAVAARAVALSRRGRLFVVALRPQAGAVDGFLRALGRSYRVVATRRLPGPRVLLGPQPTTLDVTVLVLQRVRESPPLGRTRRKG